MQQPKRTSFARVIVTPVILLVAGFLIAGIYGLAATAVIGVVYILWASRR